MLTYNTRRNNGPLGCCNIDRVIAVTTLCGFKHKAQQRIHPTMHML